MGWVDEYKKALGDIQSRTGGSSGGSSGGGSGGSRGGSGGNTPKYVGAGHEPFYKNAASRNVFNKNYKNTFDAPISKKLTSSYKKKKKEKESKKERKWFEKGLFDDGYDFGDISRTILGTSADVLENLGSGIIGMGEKAVDAMAYIAPYVENGQFYQNGGGYNLELQKQHEKVVEQSKKDLGKFIAKDLYDEEKVARAIISDPARKIGIDSETQSVFGEKSDALIQSGGQLLATAGLQAVGVPWFVTTGATSFGSETENAMNQGATYEEAGASAAISAGAEILSEKLSGGISFGGKTLDDALTKQLARGISNKLGRTAAKLGLDMAGEGAEEVFSQLASNLGSSLYKEEDITELLFNEEAMEGYLESFIGGAALGGVAGNYNAVKSNSKGVDYTSGLTKNEQAVVDKLYKDEIAKKEGKVTEKEKSKIYDSILEKMEKGYISTDTIEEVLGGEKYNQYKQAADWESSLQTEYDTLSKEYDELYNMKNGEKSSKQVDREAELKEMLPGLKAKLDNALATSTVGQQKAQLTNDVYELTKNDKLTESYNQRYQSSQKYQADVTKYDAKQQTVVQKAIDSGILNNSRRTHEFVDFIAKVSADKGVLFDFTNNAKLKESGFAVDGKQVNGFVTKDGITLNIDSAKAMNTTVGHEITHVLEGTEFYDSMKQTTFDYAKAKGEYQSRYDSIAEMYKDVKDADIEGELTADLVGDYLFSDSDFINNLSTQNRNVFQKIYDEVKYLCKVATAGSKQARELEKVKKTFENVWRESAVEKDGVEARYSLEKNGKSKYNKRSRYSETETLFMSWENGSAPVGEVKKFNRFGKIRYYEKTDSGCVELSRTQYNERSGINAENIDRRAERQFGSVNDYDGSSQGGTVGDYIGNRDSFGNAAVFGQTIREELRHDTTGGTPSVDRNTRRNSITQTEYNEEASDESGASFITFSNDYAAIRNFMKEGDKNPSADPDIRKSISDVGQEHKQYGNWNVYAKDILLDESDIAPVAENATTVETESAPVAQKTEAPEDMAPVDVTKSPVLKRLNQKLSNNKTELSNIQKLREDSSRSFDEKIAKANEQLDSKKDKDTKVANNLRRRIERLERLKADVDAEYAKRIGNIKSRITKTETDIQKYHPGLDRAEKAIARIDRRLEADKTELTEEYDLKREQFADKDSYISQKATELYNEIRKLKKGVKASEQLGYLLDHGYEWSAIKSALINIKHTPGETVNINSEAESVVREMLNESYENAQSDLEVEYLKHVNELEAKADEKRKATSVASQRKAKMEEHSKRWETIIGDTSTWEDMSLGLSYKTKTLRRILRKVVKDANGNADIHKADWIYDELETKYDHNEAQLKQESQKLKEVFFELNLNHAEDAYAHMLGELKYNPETTLTEEVVKEYYDSHKGKIDTNKVNKAISEARKTFDGLLVRVNDVLREQGMKEIPYRKGYFPHFTNPKQGWLAKLLNWKTIDNEIPTSIAGLTEMFTPQRSWQSFNKQRMGDKTDYSLYQGLDTYIHGALDWIYHIDDIQSRRALENYLRYTHSDEGVKARIEEIKANDTYDADETQKLIDGVLAEANNPLSGLVRELMNRTNTLANKKSSMDRSMEDATNRKIYSTMTNLNNRINANMVVGSFSSALTNFIPMVQSWHQVSPYFTVRGLGDFVRSSVKDDGMVAKSDFLTNRLVEEEKLYQTSWDKVSDKAAFMMNVIDNITSQTVWRSKYLQNIKEGMSEAQAIRDADQFAKNLIAGRSRGNAPTIFDAKNPLAKIFTAFQLEVANQYGYMFEDVPQDSKNTARLVKGYATAFLGAYAYNALYSSFVGRDAAFDPIGIVEDLLKDLFDDDEEENLGDDLLGFSKNIIEEVPFVGGLVGGGRVPMSSAFPYSGYTTPFESMMTDVSEKDWKSLSKEFLKPLYYLAMPVGGGQIKKTIEGLSMFSDEHPIVGSYTTSGNLRFPVDDTFGSKLQAGMFGQYASENAQKYFDQEQRTLNPEQTEIFAGLNIPIEEYWEYRDKYDEFKDVKNQTYEVANADGATEEDILKNKYFSSVNSDLSKLYDQQKKIAGSNNLYKQEKLREIQSQMEQLLSDSEHGADNIFISGVYGEVGDRRYNYDAEDKTWYEIKPKKSNGDDNWYYIQEQLSHDYLGMSYDDFWNGKQPPEGGTYYAEYNDKRYNYDAEKSQWYEIRPKNDDGSDNWYYQMEQKVTKGLGISYEEYWSKPKEYNYAYEKPGKYAISQAVGGYDSWMGYQDVLENWKSENYIRDANGDGYRKDEVKDYIFGLDVDYGQKVILYRTVYTSKKDKRKYNQDIIDYLFERGDISKQQMIDILTELDFKIDSEGYITW